MITRLLCLIAVTTSSVYAGEEMVRVTAFCKGVFVFYQFLYQHIKPRNKEDQE